MKKPVVAILLIALAVVAANVSRQRQQEREASPPPVSLPSALPGAPGAAVADDGSLARAIAARAQDVPVTGSGEVVKLLPDDREGSPHQRILVRVAGGGTVLIAHNIELAPRVAPVAVGDTLEFAGDFVWNDKGGLVHWTHPDPGGRHRAGWIRRAPQ